MPAFLFDASGSTLLAGWVLSKRSRCLDTPWSSRSSLAAAPRLFTARGSSRGPSLDAVEQRQRYLAALGRVTAQVLAQSEERVG